MREAAHSRGAKWDACLLLRALRTSALVGAADFPLPHRPAPAAVVRVEEHREAHHWLLPCCAGQKTQCRERARHQGIQGSRQMEGGGAGLPFPAREMPRAGRGLHSGQREGHDRPGRPEKKCAAAAIAEFLSRAYLAAVDGGGLSKLAGSRCSSDNAAQAFRIILLHEFASRSIRSPHLEQTSKCQRGRGFLRVFGSCPGFSLGRPTTSSSSLAQQQLHIFDVWYSSMNRSAT